MKKKRLTLKAIEEFYRELEAAELPEKLSTWSELPVYKKMALSYLGNIIDELNYEGAKSLKLKEGTENDGNKDSRT